VVKQNGKQHHDAMSAIFVARKLEFGRRFIFSQQHRVTLGASFD
jgi:hypothetical protein